MKTPIALIAILGTLSVTSSAAIAHEDSTEAGAIHWLSHSAASASVPSARQLAPYGYVAAKEADREVVLSAGQKYLNVTRLETVRLNVAGKSVIWTFDTLGAASFSLDKIVPGASGVTVHVAENLTYRGN
ncbi:MAG: CzcE family metal-binding protein [Candidatus Accumulibacter sp.]|uniref:CzcE family metal-binding protein n=1 Tax=Accumulibacter sp. TaxID=2053492 RepID=UPI002879413E|nr:CzcE family metal-binding protein [Accumulibacter sp.]MDS4016063.1 CzcE family metal-binding protein [Accumulibacter sp.]